MPTFTGDDDDDDMFPTPTDPTVNPDPYITPLQCTSVCFSGAAPIGTYHGQDVYPKDLKPEARERMKREEEAQRSHHPVLPWVW